MKCYEPCANENKRNLVAFIKPKPDLPSETDLNVEDSAKRGIRCRKETLYRMACKPTQIFIHEAFASHGPPHNIEKPCVASADEPATNSSPDKAHVVPPK